MFGVTFASVKRSGESSNVATRLETGVAKKMEKQEKFMLFSNLGRKAACV